MENDNKPVDSAEMAYDAAMTSSNTERPMSAPVPDPAPPIPPFALSFKARGEERRVSDVEQAKQLLSKGYDYNELVSELKKEKESLSPYREVEEYARQNPEWWKSVSSAWENRGVQQQQEQQNQALEPVIKELVQFKNTMMQQKEQEKIRKEDEVLSQEIHAVKEQFKQIDFSSIDGSGQTLERKILEHAAKNGINSYKSAAKDYLFDELVKLAEDRGRESVKKTMEERSKLGLLGIDTAPIKDVASPRNLKNKSYEDLLKEAKEELNL